VLFNEPKLLKFQQRFSAKCPQREVSVLFNEPKLLKFATGAETVRRSAGFSALQRAEIAEIAVVLLHRSRPLGFSALQRAEIAEMQTGVVLLVNRDTFQCSSTSRNC